MLITIFEYFAWINCQFISIYVSLLKVFVNIYKIYFFRKLGSGKRGGKIWLEVTLS